MPAWASRITRCRGCQCQCNCNVGQRVPVSRMDLWKTFVMVLDPVLWVLIHTTWRCGAAHTARRWWSTVGAWCAESCATLCAAWGDNWQTTHRRKVRQTASLRPPARYTGGVGHKRHICNGTDDGGDRHGWWQRHVRSAPARAS